MGISYAGRTYEEGKKIGLKDGLRALYCIFRYNMPHAPLPVLFGGYLIVSAKNGTVWYRKSGAGTKSASKMTKNSPEVTDSALLILPASRYRDPN